MGAFGTTFQLQKDTPKEFDDPSHPCFFAVRLMALAEMIGRADPTSLQVGRRWGQWALGMTLPEISKAARDGHLAKHRGKGGGAVRDLTYTLQMLVKENPSLDRAAVLEYLQSDEALDRFSSTNNRTLFVTGVEIDEVNRSVAYEDQERTLHKVTFDTLDRKLRAVRKNLRR